MGQPGPAFRFADFFAGVGGFHHALAASEFGGECVFASEIDENCRLVYRSQWPSMPASQIVGDIRQLTQSPEGGLRCLEDVDALVPDHDVLCAGFPCQPFSKSGPQLGLTDISRGTLFFDLARVLAAKQPRFVILENVPNLAGPRHRGTWRQIISTLRSLGYSVGDTPLLLSPHDLPPTCAGSPQNRSRVFILGARTDNRDITPQGQLFERKPFGDWDAAAWNLEVVLQPDSEIQNLADYLLRPEEIAWIEAWQSFVQGLQVDDLPSFPIWVDAFRANSSSRPEEPAWKQRFRRLNQDFYVSNRRFIDRWLEISWLPSRSYRVKDFPASRRKFEWQARASQPSASERDIWQLLIQFRPSGVRVKPANYVPALVAMSQTPIIGSRRRRLTPVEAARLQGLPDRIFQDAGIPDSVAYKQAGNSVNVGVAQFVAAQLFRSQGLSWGQGILVPLNTPPGDAHTL